MTFQLACVHAIFSSFWGAEWPPFEKWLLTRLTMCFLCVLAVCVFFLFVWGWVWVLVASGSWSLHTFYCNERTNEQTDITKTYPCSLEQFLKVEKNEIFRCKNVIFFFIFAQNIDCGYTLAPPQ